MDTEAHNPTEQELDPELAPFAGFLKGYFPMLEPSSDFRYSLGARLVMAAEERLSRGEPHWTKGIIFKGVVASAAALSVAGAGAAYLVWKSQSGQRIFTTLSHAAAKVGERRRSLATL